MADRAEPLSARPGIFVALCVAALILGTLGAVVLRAEAGSGLGPSDWAALRFTLLQASLSALFSVGLAIPVARALARRRFAGRRLMIALLGAPFILPVIVAILGLLEVFGRAGWLSQLLGLFGFEPLQIYGLHGVVLAHVFFNLPLATRLILQGWQEIPEQYADRPFHEHNRLIKSSVFNSDERRRWVHELGDRLEGAEGEVHFLLPTGGIEEWDRPGQEAHDPEGLSAFVEEARIVLPGRIPMTEIDAHINDPEFDEAVLTIFDDWVDRGVVRPK